MNEPNRYDFPQWMFDQPWDTLLSYFTDARDSAVQIKLATHLLRCDPEIARKYVNSPMLDKPQRVEELATQINAQVDDLLQCLDSLMEFRAAVMAQQEMQEHSE